MAGAGAGAQQGPGGLGPPGGAGPRPGSDWAGLPQDLLVKVAGTLVAQTEAGWAARLKGQGFLSEYIQKEMAKRKRAGNCLFVFALVCKEWRKAQLKVGYGRYGRRLRTRVKSDVILPGQVALAKWALAEGCPRSMLRHGLVAGRRAGDGRGVLGSWTMAEEAARHGHWELVQWLCGEGGFAMDEKVMLNAAFSGNLELVQGLRGEGCPWDDYTCYFAVKNGHVEVLRWARANGCEWDAATRHRAAAELGYTDNFGNLVV